VQISVESTQDITVRQMNPILATDPLIIILPSTHKFLMYLPLCKCSYLHSPTITFSLFSSRNNTWHKVQIMRCMRQISSLLSRKIRCSQRSVLNSHNLCYSLRSGDKLIPQKVILFYSKFYEFRC
jgi:hypothetical protein